MKTIVLVALLAAAACRRKPTADCEAAIAKGLDNFTAVIKGRAPSPQMEASMRTVIATLSSTLTRRCIEDRWPAEVVSCFRTVGNLKDMQACQAKLGPDQHARVATAIREVMMASRGPQMPAGMPGHPPVLAGSGSSAPDASGRMGSSGAATAPGSASAVPGGGAPSGSATPAAAAPGAK